VRELLKQMRHVQFQLALLAETPYVSEHLVRVLSEASVALAIAHDAISEERRAELSQRE
jgi:hypothetical protein